MKTLREIKNYLKGLEVETLTSNRGNKYDVVRIDKNLLNKIYNFKSLYKAIHTVNNESVYNITWFEKGALNKVYIALKKEVQNL